MTATAGHLPGESIRSFRPIPNDSGNVVSSSARVITQRAGEAGWESAVTVEWQPVADAEALRAMARQVAEKLGPEMDVWMVQPPGAETITGQFFVTSYPKNDPENDAAEVPTASIGPEFTLTAWYAPPFCSAGDVHKWYVMSDRPLRHVKSDFRSWLASEQVGAWGTKQGRIQ